jgi:hypothetical protein
MMGDILHSDSENVGVSISTCRAAGMTLEIYSTAGLIFSQALSDSPTEHSALLPVRDTLYLRAQLVTESDGQRRLHALTNPIYLAQ